MNSNIMYGLISYIAEVIGKNILVYLNSCILFSKSQLYLFFSVTLILVCSLHAVS